VNPDPSPESPETWRERLATFLRSVIPIDPVQLLFLAGIVCLIFGSRMSWWPRHLGSALTSLGPFDNQLTRSDSYGLNVLGMVAMIFSGLAGYYVCLWPGSRPVRRVISLVIGPAVAGVCLNLARFVYLSRSHSSLLDRSLFSGYFQSGQPRYWIASWGFHVAFAGILLIAIFTYQLIKSASSLPLALPGVSLTELHDAQLWCRVRFMVWVLVGPLFLFAGIPALALAFLPAFQRNANAILQNPLFQSWATVLEVVIYLAVTCWIVGREGREILRRSVRFSAPRYLLIGAGFSIGIAILISSMRYLFDRMQWSANQHGSLAPPHAAAAYFNFPSPWLLSMFFAAFFEELVFRGLLQTIFMRRYGLYRGVFLTAIVWAAYHFNFDASFTTLNEVGFLSRVGFRLSLCFALGYVLSWLTLRSGSILAASVTHTLYNVLVYGFGRSFAGKSWMWIGMWAVLAGLLFRYWPVQPSQHAEQEFLAAEPGPAT
jgi:membrane protease YdiL (CAAX protease family)